MPIKRIAHCKRMAKKGMKKQDVGWTASSFSEVDLAKMKKEGFLAQSIEVIFPSIEVIPALQPGFRVMFLAFLLRGFSHPAHEFLRGLLFVYSVQLHPLTPNSLLDIACFITLCEAFLGVNPHWGLWKYLFHLCPNASKEEVHNLGGATVSVRSESQYLTFEMAESVQGWRQKWFYIKDQKSSKADEYGLAPFDAAKPLMKLTTWDALPSETKVEKINPLMARIQERKNAT
jgi:hypothetical protein